MPDPLTAAAACLAAEHYCRLRVELATMALLLRHGGHARGWWRLLSAHRALPDGQRAYDRQAPSVRRGALVLWWRGGVERACLANRQGSCK